MTYDETLSETRFFTRDMPGNRLPWAHLKYEWKFSKNMKNWHFLVLQLYCCTYRQKNGYNHFIFILENHKTPTKRLSKALLTFEKIARFHSRKPKTRTRIRMRKHSISAPVRQRWILDGILPPFTIILRCVRKKRLRLPTSDFPIILYLSRIKSFTTDLLL